MSKLAALFPDQEGHQLLMHHSKNDPASIECHSVNAKLFSNLDPCEGARAK